MKTLNALAFMGLFILGLLSCEVKTSNDMDNPMETEPDEEPPTYTLKQIDTVTFEIDESASQLETELESVEDQLDHILEEEELN